MTYNDTKKKTQDTNKSIKTNVFARFFARASGRAYEPL